MQLKTRFLSYSPFNIFLLWSIMIIAFFISIDKSYAYKKITEHSIEIKLQGLPGITLFEIEWMKGNSKEKAVTIKKEIIRSSTLQRKIPIDWSFFRVRSLSPQGIAGPWGELYAIPGATDFSINDTFTILHDNNNAGEQNKKFLNGRVLPLRKLSNENAKTYKLNNSGSNPIPDSLHLLVDGEYDVITEANSNAEKDKLHFYLDTTPPQTKIFIYPPFYSDGEGLCLGGRTEINFKSKDDLAGVAKIFYRIRKSDSEKNDFSIYEQPIILSNILKENLKENHDKIYIDYYAVDRMKNQEKIHTIAVHYDNSSPDVTFKGTMDNQLIWLIRDRSQPITLKFFHDNNLIYTDRVYNEFKMPIDLLRQQLQKKSSNTDKSIPQKIKIKITANDILGNITVQEKTITIP